MTADGYTIEIYDEAELRRDYPELAARMDVWHRELGRPMYFMQFLVGYGGYEIYGAVDNGEMEEDLTYLVEADSIEGLIAHDTPVLDRD